MLWVTSYFLPIGIAHTLILIFLQTFLSWMILYLFSHIHKATTVSKSLRFLVEPFFSFYFCLFLTGATACWFNTHTLRGFPGTLPIHGRIDFETEYALLSSLLTGINRKRRHFTQFSDPWILEGCYSRSVLPVLYVASLSVVSTNHLETILIISFLSSIATATAIFALGRTISPRTAGQITMVFLFGGGWGIFQIFLNLPADTDFVSKTRKEVRTPHQQVFGQLCFSRTACFAIPMTLFAIALLQSSRSVLLSGIIITIVPSLSATIAFFVCVSNYQNHCVRILPFAFCILPKLRGIQIRYSPVWREYPMQGRK
jgi:hypothetical protein